LFGSICKTALKPGSWKLKLFFNPKIHDYWSTKTLSQFHMFQKVYPFKFLVSVLICQLVGVIYLACRDNLFSITASSLEDWYLLLEKSVSNPPSWIFFPVWATL